MQSQLIPSRFVHPCRLLPSRHNESSATTPSGATHQDVIRRWSNQSQLILLLASFNRSSPLPVAATRHFTMNAAPLRQAERLTKTPWIPGVISHNSPSFPLRCYACSSADAPVRGCLASPYVPSHECPRNLPWTCKGKEKTSQVQITLVN